MDSTFVLKCACYVWCLCIFSGSGEARVWSPRILIVFGEREYDCVHLCSRIVFMMGERGCGPISNSTNADVCVSGECLADNTHEIVFL